jgi:hypothetical protein
MSVKKLDRPPYVHNWVRYNYPDKWKTANEIVAFAKNAPQVTYAAGSSIVRDRIALKLDRETALKAALTTGHKKSRPHVADFVNAFYDYDATRNYTGLPSYDQFVEPYRIGREIKIPVKPLIIISEQGVLKPVFVVGWATMPLVRFQVRLLMTVLEDAVFSLTDFQKSPAEFVSFPRTEKSKTAPRAPQVWTRGDYDLLSKVEMKQQADIYLEALSLARAMILGAGAPSVAEEGRELEWDASEQGELDLEP